jgi:hypothetical protein
VASREVLQGATNLYNRMDEWRGDHTPPVLKAVWEFMLAAGQARRSLGVNKGPSTTLRVVH